jgi:hypothetical protein
VVGEESEERSLAQEDTVSSTSAGWAWETQAEEMLSFRRL